MKNIITRIYVNADMKISLSLNDYILLLDSDPSIPKESQSDFTVHSMVRPLIWCALAQVMRGELRNYLEATQPAGWTPGT